MVLELVSPTFNYFYVKSEHLGSLRNMSSVFLMTQQHSSEVLSIQLGDILCKGLICRQGLCEPSVAAKQRKT